MNAAKVISDSIVGKDFQTVIINNDPYTIYPPTIHRIAGAISCLSSVNVRDCKSFDDVFSFFKDINMQARALSWMINDDESLTDKLNKGTFGDVSKALSVAFSLVSTEVFLQAVNLTRNAIQLAAKEKL